MKKTFLLIIIFCVLLSASSVLAIDTISSTFQTFLDLPNDVKVVVGDTSPVKDVLAFNDMVFFFDKTVGARPSEMLLARQVNDLTTPNYIVMGGPCANTLWSKISTETCENWPYEGGQGIIKLVETKTNLILMIAGTSGEDTKATVKELLEGYKTDFNDDVWVMNGEVINVPIPEPECEEWPLFIIETESEYYFEIINQFYSENDDEFDFISLFANYAWRQGQPAGHGIISNEINGINQFRESQCDRHGCKDKLKGFNVFTGDVEDYNRYDFLKFKGLMHETGHQWLAHIRYIDENNNLNYGLLQDNHIHWHPELVDVGSNDPMGGRVNWVNNNDGTYTGTPRDIINEDPIFSDLSLYLMGLIPAKEVSVNPKIMIGEIINQENGILTFKGKEKIVTINQVVAAEGERVPSYSDSQKDFKMAFILITQDKNSVTQADLDKLEKIRSDAQEQWSIATRGKSKMYVGICDIDTGTPESFIASLIAQYDYVKDPSEVMALGKPYPEEVDVVVLEDNIKGQYPSFKIFGDKIVPVAYPGSYDEMTQDEFVDYVVNVKHK